MPRQPRQAKTFFPFSYPFHVTSTFLLNDNLSVFAYTFTSFLLILLQDFQVPSQGVSCVSSKLKLKSKSCIRRQVFLCLSTY